jgi:CubicO group peptidase (beta-lactamase class C family)
MNKKTARTLIITTSCLLVLVIGLFIAMSIFNSPMYAWRILSMGTSDTGDIDRFPVRLIANGDSVSPIPVEPGLVPTNVTYQYGGKLRTENLQELIQRTDTAAFIVIRDDRIILQVYHDNEESTPHTSFSVAKSFASALVGAAIADGYIGSVDDGVIRYIPELARRGLDNLTIRNLLRMDTGIRYISADDRPFFLEPFSDDALTYYPPDLRQVALSVEPSGDSIGSAFHYNNFHPLLEGLIIERATGMHVAEYLSKRIWAPMGAEYPASWSLDSQASGFEKMESGINAAAIDFARFGLLYLHNGFFHGSQVLPAKWVAGSTAPDPTDMRPFETMSSWLKLDGYYGYHWWGLKNADGTYDFCASGNLGQLIYVSPRKNMVVVRFGNEPDSGVIWPYVVQPLVNSMP